MNYKFILLIILFFQVSCANQTSNKKIEPKLNTSYFINKGFTLIYNEDLYKNKLVKGKIDDRSLILFQKNLKKDSSVKITNLINSKYIIAKVGNKVEYPFFYNSVISSRISKELDIDISEPYIEIKQILHGDSFTAKKAKTYEEEKKVAAKAPIDEIQIKDLSPKKIVKKKQNERRFNYIIKIADFYFEKSANQMKSRIIDETAIKNVYINKLSDTNFRVFLGPYKDLNSLKNSFNAILVLQFDNIEIIKK